MEFATGLVVGILTGMISWLALAAWLETQRVCAGGPGNHDKLASAGGADRLHEQPSRG